MSIKLDEDEETNRRYRSQEASMGNAKSLDTYCRYHRTREVHDLP
jgi:hypothetical protein